MTRTNQRIISVLTLAGISLPSLILADAAKPDFLSFSEGALPVAIHADEALKIGMEQALQAIDGDAGGFMLTPKPGGDNTFIEFVYKLPALTRFSEFQIPNVLETPSPGQTFIRNVEIAGSTESAEGPWIEITTIQLHVHAQKGEFTSSNFPLTEPVRWLRLRLGGGFDIQLDKTFFEFSEIIGHGEQEPVPMVEHFNGQWRGRGVLLELHQQGSAVNGCYDRRGDLTGSVDGNMLRARGISRNGEIPSTFVLTLTDSGDIAGVASTNGAPFRLYRGNRASGLDTGCSNPAVALPGCGSVLYSIGFDYDSAQLRDSANAVLDELYAGLQKSPEAAITIVGHTSSEGGEQYNQLLSQRRAEAVVTALAERGIAVARLGASGAGETQPLASNSSAAGRSLNRRVEVQCH